MSTMSLPEFTTALAAHTTYVVTTNHTINATLVIPEDVTIHFAGGVLSGGTDAKLIGNQTKIVAPIDRIFGDSLQVEGSWRIDRAYPQWFGAEANTPADCSDAINKTIAMKGAGEVFIPRGKYIVKKTLLVKYAIQLIGEAGWDSEQEKDTGTVLIADMDNASHNVENSDFTDGYFMLVNVRNGRVDPNDHESDWEVGYPIPRTLIKCIYFSNTLKHISKLKGIYAADCAEINACLWHNFQQGLAYSGKNYMDLKKVVNCTFWNSADIHRGEVLYAFDFGFLGDGLVCEHNAIHDGMYNKGIVLSGCNGGKITSNIINADVYINGCKALEFNSNHMEGGAQLSILGSSINVANNFFWKGPRPSMVIESPGGYIVSVVNLTDNLFLFYDNESNVCDVSEFDLQADGFQSLNISNSYRCFVNRGAIGLIYAYGLYVCDLAGNPIDKFNDSSYFLSRNSSVLLDYAVENNYSVYGLSEIVLSKDSETDYALWKKESGTYYYKCQFIWDKSRKIVNNVADIDHLSTGYVATKGGNGILFVLYGGNKCGYKTLLRLYRGTTNGVYTEYIDIPISGALHLYDNGYSICGYRWKPLVGGTIVGNTDIDSITYKGRNVECRGRSCPVTGIWEKGDIVYNIGSSGTNAMWIYTETTSGSSTCTWKER